MPPFKKLVREVVHTRKVIGGVGAGRPSRSRSNHSNLEEDSLCTAVTVEEMNEFDENGWAHIHHAAFRGFIKSIDKFVKTDEEQLELETSDDLKCTPFLLAVMSGNLESVKCLVELGAKVSVKNSQYHGAVELCAFKQFITLLQYFVDLDEKTLPVWKNLVVFLGSQMEDEVEAAAKCIRTLTEKKDNEMNPNWKLAFDNGLIPEITKVVRGASEKNVKVPTLHVFLNLVEQDEVKEQAVSSGMIAALIKLLKPNEGSNKVVQLAAQSLEELCVRKSYADQAVKEGALPALIKVIQTVREPEVLVHVIDALGVIVRDNPPHQTALGSQQGALSSLVALFEDCTNKPLLLSMTRTISHVVHLNESNQTVLVDEGIASYVSTLCRVRHKEVQLCAVEAIHKLAENNPHTQKIIMEGGVVNPLLDLMKKSRLANIQENTATALWALAGVDVEQRRTMAALIGVQLLIEFLSSLSENLHFIASEALCVLALGPLSEQTTISQAGGVHPLVRLLRSDKEHIVLSAIRCIQHLCVGVGYIPHAVNQGMVAASRGIKFLVALMVHSANPLIQVEAAHALGCVALGNSSNLEEIQQNLDFSYVRVLKMLYDSDPTVQLLAGASLAAFAYNSIHMQKEIAQEGGVRFSCFVTFLQSDDEYFRCLSAFQVVVLARIIPDEEQAISSAAGIKLLTDLLHDSRSDVILALAADCIARLAHTRAGVPAAFVSINSVDLLCNLLRSPAEQVRGNAAIALGYLSFHHAANRQLLNRCRLDPYLMEILTFYTSRTKLSPDFIEGWKHYKQIGLPPIQEGRQNLVGKKYVEYKQTGRPMTITSADETATSTNHQSPLLPPTHNNNNSSSAMDTDKSPRSDSRRFSRLSRASFQNSPRQSQEAGSHLSANVHSRHNSSSSGGTLLVTTADS